MAPTTPDTLQSSYTASDIPVGAYAVTVMGGWPLITCVGVTPCGLSALLSGSVDPTVTKVITVVDEGAAADYTVVTATPKLAGDAGSGRPSRSPRRWTSARSSAT